MWYKCRILQDNGNFKLVHVKELKLETICILRGICFIKQLQFSIVILLDPKPLKGKLLEWFGCHTNFSTNQMRIGTTNHDGYYYIKKAVERLGENHQYHMMHYGENNEERMTETVKQLITIFSPGL